ncbi:MAG: hypothetical protein M3432_00740 [Chloroflexota bacterium]|nr:hypothetical protein [Chloroflexota bacterium]
MTLKQYRPGPEGLEPSPVETRNWRGRLRSRRWQPAELSNPDVQHVSPVLGVLFFLGLAALTFLVLLLGYGTGFWG